MVEKMYEGIDFCLQHHWPTNEFILQHFPLAFLRQNNVFVNDKYSANNPEESIALGNSEITYRFNAAHHGILYVRDNCHVKITAKNRAFVLVHTFDTAWVEAQQYDQAQVTIIKHSADNIIKVTNDIHIREEYGYLS